MATLYQWASFNLDEWSIFELEDWDIFVVSLPIEVQLTAVAPLGSMDAVAEQHPEVIASGAFVSVLGNLLCRVNNRVFVGPVVEIVVDVELLPLEVLASYGEITIDVTAGVYEYIAGVVTTQ